jgi:hypothetical protein
MTMTSLDYRESTESEVATSENMIREFLNTDSQYVRFNVLLKALGWALLASTNERVRRLHMQDLQEQTQRGSNA